MIPVAHPPVNTVSPRFLEVEEYMPDALRNYIRDVFAFRGRMFSHKPRLLPHFLIIGAPRSGTTSLFQYLMQHPDVEAPLKKEIRFFDEHFDRGLEWYRRFFPVDDPDHKTVTGEATPSYMYLTDGPQRIRGMLPDVRIIVMLRNPIDRAYSSYHKMVSIAVEKDSFENALAREKQILEHGERPAHPAFHYLTRGLYYRDVSRWMDHIPASRLLILRSEDFYQRTEEVFSKVIQFLELASWRPTHFKTYNERRYAQLSDQARSELEAFFREPNRKLEQLTGICWQSE